MLTPQETDDLFATLRKAIANGLSIIFISHKLHEVMAISNRVVVLRHGKLVGEVETSDTDPKAMSAMMMGASASPPQIAIATPGAVLIQLDQLNTPNIGNAPGLKNVSLGLRAGQVTGLAGVSGNGQAALADLVGGMCRPASGALTLNDKPPPRWTPRDAVAQGIARIPKDRHKTGTVADFGLTEKSILERYKTSDFSTSGCLNWRAARNYTTDIIDKYDIKCPGPDTLIRLLSGGNMQKLILGRVLEASPRIILANQPVRGLDIGAVNYVHSQLLAARDAGAAVLLISEDLDEIMALSDVIHVISDGRVSPEFARGEMTPAELGIWMAGQGFEEIIRAS